MQETGTLERSCMKMKGHSAHTSVLEIAESEFKQQITCASDVTRLCIEDMIQPTYDQECKSFEKNTSARGCDTPALHRTSPVKATDIDRPGLSAALSSSHPTLSIVITYPARLSAPKMGSQIFP